MLGQRRRRWPNIEPALGQCLVFIENEVWRAIVQGNNLAAASVMDEEFSFTPQKYPGDVTKKSGQPAARECWWFPVMTEWSG